MTQIELYYKSFMAVHEHIKKYVSEKPKKTKTTVTKSKNGYKIEQVSDSDLAETFVRAELEKYLHNRRKGYNGRIIKLQHPGWPRPPLDFCDSTGYYVGEIKYTSWTFCSLDNTISQGVAIPKWKLHNLELACAFGTSTDTFRSPWFIYLDTLGAVYYLTLNKINEIISEAFVTDRPKDLSKPHVHSGRMFGGGIDQSDLAPGFQDMLFIPSDRWTYISNVPEEKMVRIKTSAAYMARKRLDLI
jgi:hypothetical protein